MKITKILIDNYLGITSFVCDDLGKWNQITGANGVGKSTILKAIREALESSGTKHQLVKTGADKGEIHLTFDDGMVVQRKMTAGSNQVTVTTNSQPVKQPQTFLDKLIGAHQMNPVDFMKGNAKQRRETILKALPVSLNFDRLMGDVMKFMRESNVVISFTSVDCDKHAFVALAQAKKIVFDTRAEINRDITRMGKAIEQDEREIPTNFNQDTDTNFNVVSATEDLVSMEGQISDFQNLLREREENKTFRADISEQIEKAAKRLGEVENDLTNAEDDQVRIDKTVEAFIAPDPGKLRAMIKAHTDNEELRNRVADIKRRRKELDEMKPDAARLDGLHKHLDIDLPKKLIDEADLIIPQLELDGDNIKFGGVELDNLATSEQMKLALEIAKVHAGQIKVICIDRFESLDPNARKVLYETSGDDEFEYFVTEVTAGDLNVQSYID